MSSTHVTYLGFDIESHPAHADGMTDMATPLKAAKQHIRGLMKQKLADVTQDSVVTQSEQLPVCSRLGLSKPMSRPPCF